MSESQLSGPMPTVSVVIPALNAGPDLEHALDSVREQTYPNVIETIVAAGDDVTRRIAEEAGATTVANPTGRTPTGLNLAIDRSVGEVIVRCDAHAVLPPTYISRAVETLVRTSAVNVGGMQVPMGQTFWEKAVAAAMRSRAGAGDARYRTGGSEGPVETVYLGVYNRAGLREFGGFDEDFTRNQDYELNHRIIASGGVVWFDPELRVEYRPRGSLRELWSQYFQYGKAKKQFSRLHPGALRWRQLAPPTLVLGLLASLILARWFPWALLAPTTYVAGLIVATASSRDSNLGTIPALATMHLAWGVGFLLGPSDH